MPTIRAYQRIGVLPWETKSFDPATGVFVGLASTPDVDRAREVVSSEAMREAADRYMQNPLITWMHDSMEPVGKALHVEVTGAGTMLEGYVTDKTPAGQKVRGLLQDGIVRSLSIGFNPYSTSYGKAADGAPDYDVTDERLTWRRIDWLETAVVSVPCNPNAVIALAKGMGLEMDWDLPLVEKGPTSFADLPLAPEGKRWDGEAAEGRVRAWAGGEDDLDWRQYRKAFAWYDGEAADQLGSYKLPFADVVNGELVAVWRGVSAATGALLGAMGGVDIPEADKAKCLNHMKRYYVAFDKPFPKADSPDIARLMEEERALEAVEAVRTGAVSVANIAAHWRKQGRDLSPEFVQQLSEAEGQLAGLLETDPAGAKGPRRGGDPSALRLPPVPRTMKVRLPALR